MPKSNLIKDKILVLWLEIVEHQVYSLLFINYHCFIEIMFLFLSFNEQEKHYWKLVAETFTPKVKISLQIFLIFSARLFILRTFDQLSSTLV